jgi:hypothetical protein
MQASKTYSPFHVELATSVGKVSGRSLRKTLPASLQTAEGQAGLGSLGSPAQLISLFVELVVSSVSTTEVDRVGVALKSASGISNLFNPAGRSGRTIGALTSEDSFDRRQDCYPCTVISTLESASKGVR